jgi:TRAP-type C4-dicarboxylate transport system substrate-binding protein
MQPKLRTLLFTTAAIAVATLFAPLSAQAQTKLRYAHVGVANAPQTLYADEVAKLIKERGFDTVSSEIYWNLERGGKKFARALKAVKSGAISMATTTSPSLGKIVPSTAVFNTPFVTATPRTACARPIADVARAQDHQSGAGRQGQYADHRQLFQGTRELTSKDKVLSPKDMQGKKYRGVPIKLWSSMITGMGAVATPVEVSELATALATGLVVGQENPLPNIYTLKLYEVQKYVMMTNHMQSVLAVFINEKVYQSIPAADRKIMEDTMIEVGLKTLDWDKETAAKYRKDLEAKGMIFVEEKDGLDVNAFRTSVLAQVNKDFPDWTGYIEQIRAVK